MSRFFRYLLFGIYLLLLFSGSGCRSTKSLLKAGSFTRLISTEELDFKYADNLIIVDVRVGEKTIPCILDTGAEVSVFAKGIIDDGTLEPVKRKKVSDSGGRKNLFTFYRVPSLRLGSLEFKSLVAIEADLSLLRKRLRCSTDIQGIVGNNLMRKAKWKIDYQKEKLWISSSLEDLQLPSDVQQLSLSGGEIGNAYVRADLDGVKEDFTFDTGKSSKMQTGEDVLKRLLDLNPATSYTTARGIMGIGLNGVRMGTTNYTLIENLRIDSLQLTQQVIEIEEDGKTASLLGNDFWEYFVLFIDWSENTLYLDPVDTMPQDTLYKKQYDIQLALETNDFIFTQQWTQHPIPLNLDLESDLTHIDGVPFDTMTNEEFCNFYQTVQEKLRSQKEIRITLNGGREVILTREKLLPQ